ncbi:MAG: AraC family transcriptional regulator [Flavobacterium sp. BFFFF2]|nr:MAG: AraC family transcriptional regulator [Flavobacterium sp. BFFFF2]
MLFQFNFYSSLLLISFSQGIIYSLLLLIKGLKTENRSNYWLSLFLLLCSLYVAPWMLGFAGWYDNQPYRDWLFYLPLQHLFLVGPVIYFYTQSLLNPSFSFTKKEAWHLLPGALYLLYIVGMWVYDVYVVQESYFYQNGMDKDFDSWYQNAGLLSMIIYFVVSLKFYNTYKKLIYQVVSYADTLLFQWIKTYLIAFLIMLLLPILFEFICYFEPDMNSYKGSWWFYLFFSVVMYYIAVAGYANLASSPIAYKWSLTKNPILLLGTTTAIESPKEETTIDIDYEIASDQAPADMQIWKTAIETLITTEKLYQNQTLNITEVAKKLDTNVAVISKAINQGFQMNFNDYINLFRVQAVKNLLLAGEHHQTTLLGIAFDCGFNSKATFNRAFKKHTGLSPKDFLKTLH